jgi:DDE domain
MISLCELRCKEREATDGSEPQGCHFSERCYSDVRAVVRRLPIALSPYRGHPQLQRRARVAIRQMKYLNNIVEQDHRAVKRVTRPVLGFKSFVSAQATRVGIELMPMLRKGQKGQIEDDAVEAALQPNNSTPWLRHPPARQGAFAPKCLQTKICDTAASGQQ